ncbi:MAG: YCF48-related protein [Salinivirgaceae bacterium]
MSNTKHFFLLIGVGFLLLSLNIKAQWYEVSGVINDVVYINSNSIIAVGFGGTIRKSTDKGLTWRIIDSKFIMDLYTIDFANENLGYVSGEYGLIKTTDGGETWSQVYDEEFDVYDWTQWEGVSFVNEDIGYLVNNRGLFYKTVDGGKNWENLHHDFYIRDNMGYVNQIYFINENKGFMCFTGYDFSGSIWCTKDGVKSWNYLPVDDCRYIHFVNDKLGFVISGKSNLYKTLDGGDNWTRIDLGISDYLSKVYFVNEKIGYIIGLFGHVLKTTDGGVSWIFQNSNISYSIYAIAADAQGMNAIGVGENATILRNANGSHSWEILSQSPPVDVILGKAEFITDDKVIAIGTKGFMAFTENGGATISTQRFKPDIDLIDIQFINSNVAYLLTSEGCIYKTINGGTKWDSLPFQDSYISNIYFYNDQFGFVFGRNSFKTTNGGLTWNKQEIKPSDIKFISDSVGYFLDAFDSDLFRTDDKGESWSYWVYPDCEPCNYAGEKLFFLNDQIGYIAGTFLFKTVDGGKSWYEIEFQERVPSEISEECIAFEFLTESIGYVFTDYDNILKTTDGGISWSIEEYRRRDIFLSNMAISETNRIVVGEDARMFMPIATLSNKQAINPKKEMAGIYPNPSSTSNITLINLQFINEQVNFELWDINGRMVFSKSIYADKADLNIQLPENLKGMFFCKLFGKEKSQAFDKLYLIK